MGAVLGFAYGSFDVFDRAHLDYLKAARAGCDYLIVGLQSDELLEECNGRRPVVPLLQRTQVVASMRQVDDVVPLTNTDMFHVWQSLRFDVLFSPVAEEQIQRERWSREIADAGVKIVATGSERPPRWPAK